MSLPETTVEERLYELYILSIGCWTSGVVIPTRVNRLCQLLSGRCLTGKKHAFAPQLRTPELKNW